MGSVSDESEIEDVAEMVEEQGKEVWEIMKESGITAKTWWNKVPDIVGEVVGKLWDMISIVLNVLLSKLTAQIAQRMNTATDAEELWNSLRDIAVNHETEFKKMLVVIANKYPKFEKYTQQTFRHVSKKNKKDFILFCINTRHNEKSNEFYKLIRKIVAKLIIKLS
jgi:hypothetical protein